MPMAITPIIITTTHSVQIWFNYHRDTIIITIRIEDRLFAQNVEIVNIIQCEIIIIIPMMISIKIIPTEIKIQIGSIEIIKIIIILQIITVIINQKIIIITNIKKKKKKGITAYSLKK